MIPAETIENIRKKFTAFDPDMNERIRRHWAASEAAGLKYGGITAVHKATGIAISTIRKGLYELANETEEPGKTDQNNKRIRRPGGGRKTVTDKDAELIPALDILVEPGSRGDPMSPLRWTCKSTRNLAEELTLQGHKISHTKVSNLLHSMEYSLQSNRKTKEGTSHPDRDAQFLHISEHVKDFQRHDQPVISVDTKKKERVGEFKNNGQEWCKKGEPIEVNIHDFVDKKLGKVVPYGVYDLLTNKGWVNVGIDHDTAEFAVGSIRRWWHEMGKPLYPYATDLLINADCGGSNGNRVRLWKFELQKLADELDITIHICHFPPGTSKWNKIEHCLFSFITMNWRGKPLIDHATIVNLISATKNKTGLEVRCLLDTKKYLKGIKISDEQMAQLNILPDAFHGEWNYTIAPRNIKQ